MNRKQFVASLVFIVIGLCYCCFISYKYSSTRDTESNLTAAVSTEYAAYADEE